MENKYRKSLIETANYLIEVRHNLLGNALNVAMNNELKEIDSAFDEGDQYTFQLAHLENSDDNNLQKIVELIKSIEKNGGLYHKHQ